MQSRAQIFTFPLLDLERKKARAHLWRLEGVFGGEGDVEVEDSSLVRRVILHFIRHTQHPSKAENSA